jgi:hypothetical protein
VLLAAPLALGQATGGAAPGAPSVPAPTATTPSTDPLPPGAAEGTQQTPQRAGPGAGATDPGAAGQAPAQAPARTPADPAGEGAAQEPAAPADEGLSAEDEAALAEEGLGAPKLPAGFTGVTGRVVDAKSGEALIEATVKVVAGAQKQVLTNLDGYYVLPLPPGVYDLRVFYELYSGRRVQNVRVEAGKPTQLDVQLSGDESAVQEVVVETRADRRKESALLQERKRAAAVSDSIGAQEIARTPDSGANDAVKRVVSATVVDNKYVLLRGMGGRYTVALLNGALVPSLEPDEASVPLDVFPTALLANLNVVKTYTADLPGVFGGGALLLETNSYPNELEFRPRVSFSGDTVSTFRRRLDQRSTLSESLTFAQRSRGLPAQAPSDGAAVVRPGYGADQVAALGRTLPKDWLGGSAQTAPNLSVGASLGNSVRFGGSRLGYLASVSFQRKESIVPAFLGVVDANDEYQESQDAILGAEVAQLGGLLNLGLQLDRDNEVTALGFLTRGTDERTQRAVGFNDGVSDDLDQTRLQFIERSLGFAQLKGFHRLDVLGDMELDWQGNYSRVVRWEPDTRDIAYFERPEGQDTFFDAPNSATRFFSDLGEDSYGGTLNATLPLAWARLKVGGLYQRNGRAFLARRFRYTIRDEVVDPTLPPDQLFSDANIGALPSDAVRFNERTQAADGYTGFLTQVAGFASADLKPLEPLRLVVGARLESSDQGITTDPRFATDGRGVQTGRQAQLYVLPSANATFSLSPEVNLRAGYSLTLARPTFREIAPFFFFDFVRRRGVTGNEALVPTRIHAGDLRAEWFVGENEVLAASGFYKQLLDPIESVLANAGQEVTFRNAQAGQVYGLELEARSTLARLSPSLSNFRVGANLTLIRSSVRLRPQDQTVQTNLDRPLQGQSPYVVNVNLGWADPQLGSEVSALYNVSGPRLTDVGIVGLPDVYEQPFHRVDLVFSQSFKSGLQLKATVANVLNARQYQTQGPLDVFSFSPGVSASLSLGLNL